ncbi:phosphate acyltransferase PlsX [bacterium]|nr:phosphate acyltransferase PlsX [bacterium]
MVRIAVDAMGGDHSPAVVVEGIRLLPSGEDIAILLVGDPDAIAACDVAGLPVEVIPARDVVEMHESPSAALKKKPNSSIAVCMNLVKEGRADAAVSMGNTGAVMAFALFLLERVPGVSRPAIATVIPSPSKPTLLLDVGANVDCKPIHLAQFAVMGAIYMEEVLGRPNPTVGLLSIGSEASKGNETTIAARALLEGAPVNFAGHAEGNDIFAGAFDVVVCDGFVGNIVPSSARAWRTFSSGRHSPT